MATVDWFSLDWSDVGKSTTRIIHERRQGILCHVPGCPSPVRRLGNLCLKHDNARKRYGHPKATSSLSKHQLGPWLERAERFLEANKDHQGIVNAINFLDGLIRDAFVYPLSDKSTDRKAARSACRWSRRWRCRPTSPRWPTRKAPPAGSTCSPGWWLSRPWLSGTSEPSSSPMTTTSTPLCRSCSRPSEREG